MQFSIQNYMSVCTKIVGGRAVGELTTLPQSLVRFSPAPRATDSHDFGAALREIIGRIAGRKISTPWIVFLVTPLGVTLTLTPCSNCLSPFSNSGYAPDHS